MDYDMYPSSRVHFFLTKIFPSGDLKRTSFHLSRMYLFIMSDTSAPAPKKRTVKSKKDKSSEPKPVKIPENNLQADETTAQS